MEDKCEYIESIYGKEYFPDIQKVLDLLNDKEDTVRIEMVEACYAVKQEKIRIELWKRFRMTKGLEKGYLMLTLTYIYMNEPENIVDILVQYTNSDDDIEKLDAYVGLVLLGKKNFFMEILRFFDHSSYQIRSRTCNSLSELLYEKKISEDNLALLKEAVFTLEKKEKTRAVKSSIERLLFEIKQYKSS